MGGRDFYAMLGVRRDADEAELKKAYKKCAIKWHPDKHAGKGEVERATAEEKFKGIAEAFEVLSDKDKRAIYDQFGEDGLKQAGPGGVPSAGMSGASVPGGVPGNMHFSFSTNGGGSMDAMRAQEIFAQFFGSGGGLGGGMMMDDDDDPFSSLLGGRGIPGMMSGRMHGGRGAAMSGLRRRRGSSEADDRPDRLPRDALVRLVDLKESERHNGQIGRVECFDEATGRYVISMDGSTQLKVRPQNVRQVLTDARVVGVKNEGSLNGRVASAASYDASSKRYKCEGLKGDRTVVALKPENVVLPKRCRVVVDGVQSRPALNGKVGAVVDADTERYVIQLPDERLRLRFGSVVAC